MKISAVLVAGALAVSACAPKSELDAAQVRVGQLEREVGSLRAQLARKPNLPITLGFREALLGSGLVAVVETVEKKPLTVLVSLESAALGTKKSKEVRLRHDGINELSYSDGMTIELGDKLTFENSSYSAVEFTAPESL